MGFEETAKIILKVVAQTTDTAKVRKALESTGKVAQKQGVAMAAVSKSLQKQGIAGKQLNGTLKSMASNMGALGMELRGSGKFWDTNTKKQIQAGEVAKRAMANMAAGNQFAAKAGPEQAATIANVTKGLLAQGTSLFDVMRGWKTLYSNQKTFGVGMSEDGKNLAKMGKDGKKSVMSLGDGMKTVGKAGVRPFRGEFMSLMFAGMALSSVFGGMIKQVLQMTGIFDLWRGILASILLPVLIPLIQQYLPKFLEWMKDPAHKKMLADWILWGFVIGTALMLIGQIGLALTGFGALVTVVKPIGTLFLWIGKTMGVVKWGIGSVLSVLTIMIVAFQGLWDIFKGIAQSKTWLVVKGILLVILAVVAVIVAAFTSIPIAIIAAVTAVIALIVNLLSKLKPVQDFFSKVGNSLTFKGWKTDEQVRGFATGGIVNKPTLAMIGEAGPEAVVPLSGPNAGGGGIGSINYNPTININASGGGGIDIDSLVRTINDRLYDDLRRNGTR